METKQSKVDEEIRKFIDQMKDIYDHLLIFIDNPDPKAEEDYVNFIEINTNYEIQRNKEIFNQFIDLLVNISNNHHRQAGFFEKIERIIHHYQDTIKASNSKIEIYEQFKSNKRLLYFLIKEQILTFDADISQIIICDDSAQYSNFFLPEISKNTNSQIGNNENLNYYLNNLDEYENKRSTGENDSYICSLIQN